MGGGDSIVVFNIYRIVFLFHSTARVLVSWDGASEREGGGEERDKGRSPCVMREGR